MRRIPWELLALPALGISRALPDTGWGRWALRGAAVLVGALVGVVLAVAFFAVF